MQRWINRKDRFVTSRQYLFPSNFGSSDRRCARSPSQQPARYSSPVSAAIIKSRSCIARPGRTSFSDSCEMSRPILQAFIPIRVAVAQSSWSRPNVAGPSRVRFFAQHRCLAQALAKSVDGDERADVQTHAATEAIPLAAPAPSMSAEGDASIPTSPTVNPSRSSPDKAESSFREQRSDDRHEVTTNNPTLTLEDRIAVLRARAAEAYKQGHTTASTWSAETRKQAQERFERLKSEIGRLSWRINEATGYEEIDRLKALVATRGAYTILEPSCPCTDNRLNGRG